MISTILTTHDWSRVGYLLDCIDELDTDEIIVVLDNKWIAEAVKSDDCTIVLDESVSCLAEARNLGASVANNDIIAFLDDDVIVSESWRETILNAYDRGAIAAGGPAEPIWPNDRPAWLPKQWDWLVGCGPYYDHEIEIRNTYGCNISFKRSVFKELDGFNTAYGMRNDLTQGEETELCNRMFDAFGNGTTYRPNANVYHRVQSEQLELSYLIERAYEQGRAKARLGTGEAESHFLRSAIRDIRRNPKSMLYLMAVGGGFGLTNLQQFNPAKRIHK